MVDMVTMARAMAVNAHGVQKYGTRPYIEHLEAVATLVTPWGSQAQVVAYLHDALEDTTLTADEIAQAFGDTVAECVLLVTDPKGGTRAERKRQTYARLSNVNDRMGLALIVKAADRLANVRQCVADNNATLLRMYREEHPAFVTAVHRSDLNDEFFRELDHLLALASNRKGA